MQPWLINEYKYVFYHMPLLANQTNKFKAYLWIHFLTSELVQKPTQLWSTTGDFLHHRKKQNLQVLYFNPVTYK